MLFKNMSICPTLKWPNIQQNMDELLELYNLLFCILSLLLTTIFFFWAEKNKALRISLDFKPSKICLPIFFLLFENARFFLYSF